MPASAGTSTCAVNVVPPGGTVTGRVPGSPFSVTHDQSARWKNSISKVHSMPSMANSSLGAKRWMRMPSWVRPAGSATRPSRTFDWSTVSA